MKQIRWRRCWSTFVSMQTAWTRVMRQINEAAMRRNCMNTYQIIKRDYCHTRNGESGYRKQGLELYIKTWACRKTRIVQ